MSEPLVQNEQHWDSWTHAKPPRDAIFMSAVTLLTYEPRSNSVLLFIFSNIWHLHLELQQSSGHNLSGRSLHG